MEWSESRNYCETTTIIVNVTLTIEHEQLHSDCPYQVSKNLAKWSLETCTNKAKWLTLKVLVTTIDAQWEGMGDVGLARYEPVLLPPCPTIRV